MKFQVYLVCIRNEDILEFEFDAEWDQKVRRLKLSKEVGKDQSADYEGRGFKPLRSTSVKLMGSHFHV